MDYPKKDVLLYRAYVSSEPRFFTIKDLQKMTGWSENVVQIKNPADIVIQPVVTGRSHIDRQDLLMVSKPLSQSLVSVFSFALLIAICILLFLYVIDYFYQTVSAEPGLMIPEDTFFRA